MAKAWKRGRGTLGPMAPLIGTWTAKDETGRTLCRRTFARVLGGKYIQLAAEWDLGAKTYAEIALFGATPDGLGFWSFTSDGKRSEGRVADVSDLHDDAIGFEADMPAGLARQAYWPADDGAVYWVVESKTKRGWNRFVRHCYRRVED